MTIYRNMEEAIPKELELLVGDDPLATLKSGSRNGFTREQLAHVITLRNPYERFHILKHRNANPFAMVAETLWVLAGRNDIEWLSYYLPRAYDFSDDGVTWRAGYGPRLRKWEGTGPDGYSPRPVDQVMEVCRILRKDSMSRRAVISLFDPDDDYADSKDIPCNNWLQFLIRNNRLHLFVSVRSNDAMWGWSAINAFEWSVLQEIMAHSLGIPIGPLTTFIGSFHIYEKHVERARKIVDAESRFESPHLYQGTPHQPDWYWSVENLDSATGYIFEQEQQLRRNSLHILTLEEYVPRLRPIDLDILRMLDIYSRVQRSDLAKKTLRERVNRIGHDDMRAAVVEYLDRTPFGATEAAANIVPVSIDLEQESGDMKVVTDLLTRLQAAKGRTYGDSWKRHGELVSIMANISRKHDRIENLRNQPGVDPGDETLVDTVADLAVYNILYDAWLHNDGWSDAIARVMKLFVTTRRSATECLDIVARSYHDLEVVNRVDISDPSAILRMADKEVIVRSIALWSIKWLETRRASQTEDWRKLVDYVNSISKPGDKSYGETEA